MSGKSGPSYTIYLVLVVVLAVAAAAAGWRLYLSPAAQVAARRNSRDRSAARDNRFGAVGGYHES